MATRKFTGTIKVNGSAEIDTPRGIFTLIPYPPEVLEAWEMEKMGKSLFAYLENKVATVEGDLINNQLFNARIVVKRLPTRQVDIAPEMPHDKFAKEIEKHFKKDSRLIAAKLNAIAITTVSAFYHRLKDYKPEIRAFSKYLKVSEEAITSFLEAIEGAKANLTLIAAPVKYPVKRGVNIKLIAQKTGVRLKTRAAATPPPFPNLAITPKLPSEVNLSKKVTGVKNQGPRSTCVAHVGAALLEYELINKGLYKKNFDLSEQYLYWGCKQIDGAPNDEGTFIEYAVEVMKRGVKGKNVGAGVCRERDWPYNITPMAGNESHDPPPKKALKANKHPVIKYKKLKHNSIKDLKTHLAEGHCVGLSVYTYHFWTDAYAWSEGRISLPIQIEPDGAHAICLVGYKDNDASHSDGDFIFKNSWDTTWGVMRADKGFGSLPYRYVIQEAIEAWIIEV